MITARRSFPCRVPGLESLLDDLGTNEGQAVNQDATARGKGRPDDPVLVDPDLAPGDRALIETNAWALVPFAESSAKPVRTDSGFWDGRGPLYAVSATGSGIAGGLVELFASWSHPPFGEATTWQTAPTAMLLLWAAYFLFVLATLSGAGLAFEAAKAWLSLHEQRRIAPRAAELRGHYLRPGKDLDWRGQNLLRRARTAAAAITSSAVHVDGVLDAASHNVRLPALVWSVGRELADLKAAKDQAENASADGGAPVEAVVAPYRAAVARGVEAIERRVAALESYAEEVSRLDAQHRALTAAEALEGTMLELEVSREVRDAAGLAEVAAMADDLPASRAVLEQELAAAAERLSALAAPSADPTDLSRPLGADAPRSGRAD